MRTLILGASGLVGKALKKRLSQTDEVLTPASCELNLLDEKAVEEYFEKNQFDTVINAAGLVGGIHANSHNQSEFLFQNTLIQILPLRMAAKKGVKKYFNLGSSCIYPRETRQPISESSLLSGPLEPTNAGYALAKITGAKFGEFLRSESKLNVTTLMPTNIFGYEKVNQIEDAHVITALILRFMKAKKKQSQEVEVWGSGKAKREFMHVDEFADAVHFLTSIETELPAIMNVGTGHELSIAELASKIKNLLELKSEIVYNPDAPEGVERKWVDSHFLDKLGWQPSKSFDESLKITINDYLRDEK